MNPRLERYAPLTLALLLVWPACDLQWDNPWDNKGTNPMLDGAAPPADKGKKRDKTVRRDTKKPPPDTRPRRDKKAPPDRKVFLDKYVVPDKKVPPDKMPPPDKKVPPDIAPPPDSKPWQCTKNSDCDDKLHCTQDTCTPAKKCVNKFWGNGCFISGACHGNKKLNPLNPCQMCDTSRSPTSWSNKPDNTTCTADGLTCTKDICSKGVCTHPVHNGCLVNKTCYKAADPDPTDKCKVCAPTASSTAFTFVAGRECSSSTVAGICMASKCRMMTKSIHQPKGASATLFWDVDYIPAANKAYAVGEVSGVKDDGIILDVASSLGSSPVESLTKEKLYGISYRMAVGKNGAVHMYSSGAWHQDKIITSAIGGGKDRYGVWGAKVSSADTFFIGGRRNSTVRGIYRCVLPGTGGYTCSKHYGVAMDRRIGPIHGTLTASGGQGPLWAATIGSNQPDDIYYNSGSSTNWSNKSPTGCTDINGAPCYHGGELLAMHGSSSSDIWVVGDIGFLMRYDGVKWNRVNNAIANQTLHKIRSVYTSAQDKLTLIVSDSNLGGGIGYRVMVHTYHHVTKKWTGPIVLHKSTFFSIDRIVAMGGKDLSDLWLVGQIRASGKNMGWIVTFK